MLWRSDNIPAKIGHCAFLKLTCISNGLFRVCCARHCMALSRGDLNVLKSNSNADPLMSTHSQAFTSSWSTDVFCSL